jgi:hypothetical protein
MALSNESVRGTGIAGLIISGVGILIYTIFFLVVWLEGILPAPVNYPGHIGYVVANVFLVILAFTGYILMIVAMAVLNWEERGQLKRDLMVIGGAVAFVGISLSWILSSDQWLTPSSGGLQWVWWILTIIGLVVFIRAARYSDAPETYVIIPNK